MFQLIVAAMSSSADAGDPMTGTWADITFSHFKGGSDSNSGAVTFTSGGTRQVLITHDIAIGNLKVSINGGANISVSSGYTVDVTTGTTLVFTYTCFWASESATVTVYDNTLSATVDTFTCDFTFTG